MIVIFQITMLEMLEVTLRVLPGRDPMPSSPHSTALTGSKSGSGVGISDPFLSSVWQSDDAPLFVTLTLALLLMLLLLLLVLAGVEEEKDVVVTGWDVVVLDTQTVTVTGVVMVGVGRLVRVRGEARASDWCCMLAGALPPFRVTGGAATMQAGMEVTVRVPCAGTADTGMVICKGRDICWAGWPLVRETLLRMPAPCTSWGVITLAVTGSRVGLSTWLLPTEPLPLGMILPGASRIKGFGICRLTAPGGELDRSGLDLMIGFWALWTCMQSVFCCSGVLDWPITLAGLMIAPEKGQCNHIYYPIQSTDILFCFKQKTHLHKLARYFS